MEAVSVLAGNTKGGSITVPLTSYLAGLESAVWLLTIFVFICKTDYSKPVKQEVNYTVILPLLVFPGPGYELVSLLKPELHWRGLARWRQRPRHMLVLAMATLVNATQIGSRCPRWPGQVRKAISHRDIAYVFASNFADVNEPLQMLARNSSHTAI
jgi:hypothetical protein